MVSHRPTPDGLCSGQLDRSRVMGGFYHEASAEESLGGWAGHGWREAGFDLRFARKKPMRGREEGLPRSSRRPARSEEGWSSLLKFNGH